MELRIAQTVFGLMAAFAPAFALEYPVRHKRLLVDCGGRLRLETNSIAYAGLCGKGDRRQELVWSYQDPQRVELFEDRIVLRGYRDRKWMGGADELYDFRLEGKVDAAELYRHLRERMDERLVARIAYAEGTPLWTLPAKRPARIEGTQGELRLYEWGLVYASAAAGASRTWRDADLRNVSQAGALSFMVETAEGEFVFQLKRGLDRARFDKLWLRLNRPRGLELISTQQKETREP